MLWFYPFGPNLAGVPGEIGQIAVTADSQHFASNLPAQKLRNQGPSLRKRNRGLRFGAARSLKANLQEALLLDLYRLGLTGGTPAQLKQRSHVSKATDRTKWQSSHSSGKDRRQAARGPAA
jgi:hypothetical protein